MGGAAGGLPRVGVDGPVRRSPVRHEERHVGGLPHPRERPDEPEEGLAEGKPGHGGLLSAHRDGGAEAEG